MIVIVIVMIGIVVAIENRASRAGIIRYHRKSNSNSNSNSKNKNKIIVIIVIVIVIRTRSKL